MDIDVAGIHRYRNRRIAGSGAPGHGRLGILAIRMKDRQMRYRTQRRVEDDQRGEDGLAPRPGETISKSVDHEHVRLIRLSWKYTRIPVSGQRTNMQGTRSYGRRQGTSDSRDSIRDSTARWVASLPVNQGPRRAGDLGRTPRYTPAFSGRFPRVGTHFRCSIAARPPQVAARPPRPLCTFAAGGSFVRRH